MLEAVIFHSDHLELSEQFDGTTGFEKSVRNLTWSYAAFLSAVRARGNALAAPPTGEARPADTVATAPEPGNARARWVATNAMMNTQQLLVLDDQWSALIEDASKEPAGASRETLPVLRQAVTDMQAGLVRARRDAAATRTVLLSISDEAYAQGIAAITASLELATELADIRNALGDAISRSAAIAACEQIERDAHGEGALLREKLRTFEEGTLAAGDLRLPFRCAMTLLALSAAVVSAIGLGGATVFVGLGAVSGTWFASRTWVSDNCPVPFAKATTAAPTPEQGDAPS
jgi:hypothetical protein